jgi:hypothetical protein
VFFLCTAGSGTFNIRLSLGGLDGAFFSSDVYGTVSFSDFEYGEMVEGGGIFNIASLCIETG